MFNESVLGLFASSHTEYNYKIDGISDSAPTLKDMAMKAIEILQTNPNGFFLFVEGGRIDHGLHDNQAHIALEETAEFSRTIKIATQMLSFDDTLFVVTSDHSHTMTLSGYPVSYFDIVFALKSFRFSWNFEYFIRGSIKWLNEIPRIAAESLIIMWFFSLKLKDRGSNIFGIASRGDDDFIPYLKLSFANGPSFKPRNTTQREDPSKSEELNNFDYRSPSTLPLKDETHGGDDVAIFAAGPHAHMFTGVMEQHLIPHLMAYASCIGNGITYCNKTRGLDAI